YEILLPKPYIPLPRVIHEGKGYRLELEVSPDPMRDALLIRFCLAGAGARLYVLLAPHLDGSGRHNNAGAGDELLAWKGGNAVVLTSSCGFSRTSVGYVGYSDGWQDFAQHGAMRWDYGEALDGNVALTGELAA